ncbi:HesB/IscA family protein [Buchnera aphidicola]|uniref:HesB/IscA family protein n=1 Tax=Buchnera aphidicola TaxID=9 RepID=UPI003464A53D
MKKINKKGIFITENAQKYLNKLIKKKNNSIGIEIKIKKSGCAGWKYHLYLIKKEDIKDKDQFYIYHIKDINIYVIKKNIKLIDGTEIDLLKNDGINFSIIFKNKKIDTFCGCGESFHITI